MANRQQRFRMITAAYYAVGLAGMIAMIASRAHSWRDWLFYVAFFLGAGGMAYLFQQWRRAGNLLARNWLFAAFGSWMLAVFVGSGSQTPGYFIAGLGLALGLIGAVVVLFRRRRENQA